MVVVLAVVGGAAMERLQVWAQEGVYLVAPGRSQAVTAALGRGRAVAAAVAAGLAVTVAAGREKKGHPPMWAKWCLATLHQE